MSMSAIASAPRMVGRSAELELLLEALESGARGDASVTIIRGEAGIGKTRLVEEVLGASGTAASRSTRRWALVLVVLLIAGGIVLQNLG